jgi:hypothetical protein
MLHKVFPDNPTIDLAVPGLPDLPYGTTQFPLAYAYGAVAGPTLDAIFGGLAGNPLLPVVQNFFNGYVPSGGTGQLVGYNLFNGEPMNELTGTGRSAVETLNSFEIGYKGLIANKLSVALDVYTYERKGFTQFTAIGPTFNLVGANIADDLGAQVAADFAAGCWSNRCSNGFYTRTIYCSRNSTSYMGYRSSCRRTFPRVSSNSAYWRSNWRNY